eukprot:gene20109-26832_t
MNTPYPSPRHLQDRSLLSAEPHDFHKDSLWGPLRHHSQYILALDSAWESPERQQILLDTVLRAGAVVTAFIPPLSWLVSAPPEALTVLMDLSDLLKSLKTTAKRGQDVSVDRDSGTGNGDAKNVDAKIDSGAVNGGGSTGDFKSGSSSKSNVGKCSADNSCTAFPEDSLLLIHVQLSSFPAVKLEHMHLRQPDLPDPLHHFEPNYAKLFQWQRQQHGKQHVNGTYSPALAALRDWPAALGALGLQGGCVGEVLLESHNAVMVAVCPQVRLASRAPALDSPGPSRPPSAASRPVMLRGESLPFRTAAEIVGGGRTSPEEEVPDWRSKYSSHVSDRRRTVEEAVQDKSSSEQGSTGSGSSAKACWVGPIQGRPHGAHHHQPFSPSLPPIPTTREASGPGFTTSQPYYPSPQAERQSGPNSYDFVNI